MAMGYVEKAVRFRRRLLLLVFFVFLFIVLVSLFLRIVFDIKVSLDPLDFSSCPE